MNRIVATLIILAGACAAADGPPGGSDLLGDKPPQHPGQGDGARPRGPEEIFKLADANGDGKVSKEELEAALAKQRQAGKERAFEAMDTNHDGTVSKEEFMAFEPPQPPGPPGQNGGDGQRKGPPGGPPGQNGGDGQHKGPPGGGPGGPSGRQPSAEMMMKHFDLNGDGFITQDEVRQVQEQRKGKEGEHGPGGGGPPAPKPGD